MLPLTQATRCNFEIILQFDTSEFHLVACVSGRILAYFFQKMGFHFSKNREKYNKKNGKNSDKNKNEAGAVYCLIYIFSDFIVDVLIF